MESGDSKDNQNPNNSSKCFPIVAIGASAGGLEAFDNFFSRVPAKTGMAYVVITHLDRDHISVLADLLKKYTPMPVFSIIDGVKVKCDTIYVIPPRKNVTIKDGILNLVEQGEPHYSNLPINFFFSALAQERGENAVAVILSGAGTDGTLGARDIKLHGGVVIAQDPQSAKFDSMPSTAINSGYVDFILSSELIPAQIDKWSKDGIQDGRVSIELSQIFSIIRARTGYDFSSYKLTTIRRRIEKQMLIHNLTAMSDYIILLRKDTDAVDKLFKDFLIGVTRFFRDPAEFIPLKDSIIPALLKDKPTDYNLRVWVPGCSTGEEVYSIAMIIAEYMEENNQQYYVQIFGTDIDPKALMVARNAVYSNAITHDVSPERLKRFFTKEKGKYRIKKEIRSMTIFGEQNLIKDPPFTKVDIISCRNLLIYIGIRLQKKIIPMFHYCLKPNGVLFLGSSESIGGNADLFETCDKKTKLFQRKVSESSKRSVLSLGHHSQAEPYAVHTMKEKLLIRENSDSDQAIKKLLLAKYISPCIVVDAGEIIYLYGSINRYVKPSLLPDKYNITDVVHADIKKILKSALLTAASKKSEVVYHNLTIHDKENAHAIVLRVIPVVDIAVLHGYFLIFFDPEITESDNDNFRNDDTVTKNNRQINKLERELLYTKENLQATIEELESSNEELQSLNEELQSTNEEIETSKEELHSLNEELVITNTELQARIDQLAVIHDDMTNLFNSTDIATFFLDNNLCIKRYTPSVQDFINLIPSDIGRSISHFATNIKYDKLMEDTEEVLRTLNQKMIEVQTKTDRWLLIRIIPYRTIANMIDGVIITLTDITEHKESERKLNVLNGALNTALSMSKNILDTVMMPIMILSLDLRVMSTNRAFYKYFNLLPEEVIGKYLNQIKGWNIPSLRDALESDLPADVSADGLEVEMDLPKYGSTTLAFNIRKIQDPVNNSSVIMLAIGPKNER